MGISQFEMFFVDQWKRDRKFTVKNNIVSLNEHSTENLDQAESFTCAF